MILLRLVLGGFSGVMGSRSSVAFIIKLNLNLFLSHDSYGVFYECLKCSNSPSYSSLLELKCLLALCAFWKMIVLQLPTHSRPALWKFPLHMVGLILNKRPSDTTIQSSGALFLRISLLPCNSSKLGLPKLYVCLS